nr:hypothetical protein [Tanacetum cinerariifolium]
MKLIPDLIRVDLFRVKLPRVVPPIEAALTPTPVPTQPITTDAPTVTNVVLESNALTVVELRVSKLEKDVSEPKTVDNSSKALDAALKEYDLKSTLYQSMHANKSFNRNPANHRLYHALMEALIKDENAMDKRVADTVKDHKRKHDDDEDNDDKDPPAGLNQGKNTKRRKTKESKSSKKPSYTKETPKGKAPTKGSKTTKFALTKEPVVEPIAEVIMDDAGDDVTSDPEVTHTTSITKTKAARYEIKGIEDMVPTLWITIKHAYDKDTSMGIKH